MEKLKVVKTLRLVDDFSVKTADMRDPNWAEIVSYSFKKTGFAIITHHGIRKDMIDAAYAQWADFFATDDKYRYLSKNGTSGYFPYKSENAKDSSVKDLKEFYHVHFPFNNVPSGISIAVMQDLTTKLNEIARNILWNLQSEIPKDLSRLQGETLQSMVKDSSNTLLRILHYPPLPQEVEPNAVRAAAHGDINLITLLIAATQPGLEVMDLKGEWHAVECEPGALVVNVGDLLEIASGGLFKSTTHRVINPPGENVSRYSMPFFVHPRPNCLLAENLPAEKALKQRLKEIGLIDDSEI